jgi:hypothetical protein
MRAAIVPLLLVAAATTLPAACSSGATSDRGLSAYLRVAGAQYVKGPMPQGSASGPSVVSINLVNSTIYPNLLNDPVSGALSPTAQSVAIGLQGDAGYWILVAGPPDVATPTDPSFGASMSFSGGIIAGNYTLVARAVDAAGNFGMPATQMLAGMASGPLVPAPSGHLVVTLTWTNDTNLDLHVVDPSGVDLFWGDQSTQPAPPAQPVDGGSYGTIDFDSNGNCVIDGLDREDAFWTLPPPSGHYVVRVDAASLCGQPISYWTVQAVLDGRVLGVAQGTAVDASTRGTHGVGAGVTALEFDVP